MNSKQKRRSMRYWKYTVEVYEPWWSMDRSDWLIKNFGCKNKGRRYAWCSWNPTEYSFHQEKDYVAFLLRWGGQ